MSEFLKYLIESSLLSAILYGVYGLLLRKESSHRFNRFYLLSAIILAVLVPFLSFNIGVSLDNILLNTNHLPEFTLGANQEGISWFNSINVTTYILSIYLLGVILFAFRFSFRLNKLISLIRSNSAQYVSSGAYYLVETQGSFPTSSFLNYLFWDNSAQLDESEKERVKQHELVHICEKHSWDLILVEILKCVFWFNPFIYFFKNQMAMVHEYLADQNVLRFTQPAEYQQLILKQLFQVNALAFSNPFNQSQILKRMKMMKSNQSIHPWKIITSIIITSGIVAFSACEVQETSVAKEKVKVEGEILQVVDNMPTFKGGQEAYVEFLMSNLKYPNEAQNQGVEGIVYVQFIVTKDGKVAEAQIKKGVSKELDAEALRVVNMCPDWNPGSHEGKLVNTIFMMPIKFKLS